MFDYTRTLFTFLIAALLIIAGNRAYAADEQAARQFADKVGKQVLQVVNGGGSEAQMEQGLRQLFTTYVDMDWMGQFVLGPGWNQTSEAQRSKYLAAYRKLLLTRYTTNFTDYSGSKYVITGVKPESDNQYTVNMKINSPEAKVEQTLAGYRLRAEGGSYKIVDIIIEGVSLLITQRSEFSSVLQQQGMDGLIQAIESKVKTE